MVHRTPPQPLHVGATTSFWSPKRIERLSPLTVLSWILALQQKLQNPYSAAHLNFCGRGDSKLTLKWWISFTSLPLKRELPNFGFTAEGPPAFRGCRLPFCPQKRSPLALVLCQVLNQAVYVYFLPLLHRVNRLIWLSRIGFRFWYLFRYFF